MFDTLQSIKEQLFDAPADIKSAFNTLVEYFDFGKGKGKGGINRIPAVASMERPGGSGKGVTWGPVREAFIYMVPETSVNPIGKGMSAKQYCEDYADEKGAKFLKFVGVFQDYDKAQKAASDLDKEYEKWNKEHEVKK